MRYRGRLVIMEFAYPYRSPTTLCAVTSLILLFFAYVGGDTPELLGFETSGESPGIILTKRSSPWAADSAEISRAPAPTSGIFSAHYPPPTPGASAPATSGVSAYYPPPPHATTTGSPASQPVSSGGGFQSSSPPVTYRVQDQAYNYYNHESELKDGSVTFNNDKGSFAATSLGESHSASALKGMPYAGSTLGDTISALGQKETQAPAMQAPIPEQPAVQPPPTQPQVPVPQAPPQAPVPQAPPQLPVPQAPPQAPVPQAPPQLPVPQAPPQVPVPQAPPQAPVPQAPPQLPVPQAPPQAPVPQAPPQLPVPQAPPQVPVPQAPPQAPVPQAPPQLPVPQAPPQVPVPQAPPQSAPLDHHVQQPHPPQEQQPQPPLQLPPTQHQPPPPDHQVPVQQPPPQHQDVPVQPPPTQEPSTPQHPPVQPQSLPPHALSQQDEGVMQHQHFQQLASQLVSTAKENPTQEQHPPGHWPPTQEHHHPLNLPIEIKMESNQQPPVEPHIPQPAHHDSRPGQWNGEQMPTEALPAVTPSMNIEQHQVPSQIPSQYLPSPPHYTPSSPHPGEKVQQVFNPEQFLVGLLQGNVTLPKLEFPGGANPFSTLLQSVGILNSAPEEAPKISITITTAPGSPPAIQPAPASSAQPTPVAAPPPNQTQG